LNPAVRIAKRLIDVASASVALTLTLPLYPVIAAAIRLETRGPIFIRQKRAGQLIPPDAGARPDSFRFEEFHMLKFRSMRADAEKLTGAVIASKGDPRITKVGKLLRKTRLDEIPQFLNVLRGDMSLVGPRPERPELMSQLAMAIPFFEERMRGLKPGITGLAQVSLGYTGEVLPGSEIEPYAKDLQNPFDVAGAENSLADDMRMKLLYDLAYSVATDRLSTFLTMEARIVIKTPLVMLKALG